MNLFAQDVTDAARALASKIAAKGWAGASAEIRLSSNGKINIWLQADSTLAFPRKYTDSSYDFECTGDHHSLAAAVAAAERLIAAMPEEPTEAMRPWFEGAAT